MSESDPNPDSSSVIKTYSSFVRGRNALAVRAEFSQIYVDYYLHLMDHGLRNEPAHDQLLKDALAALTLHLTSRPWRETHAWTLNFQEPLLNLFVTGGSLAGTVTGRVFTENVRETGRGLFHAQVTSQGEDARRSAIELKSANVFAAVENFYRQSEQRTARFFACSDEDFMLISAQPDCDEAWLAALTDESIQTLDQDEELSLLETREFRFSCGCTLERIFPALAPLASKGIDDLFRGDQSIGVTCPRCAAKWRVTREQLEAVMAS